MSFWISFLLCTIFKFIGTKFATGFLDVLLLFAGKENVEKVKGESRERFKIYYVVVVLVLLLSALRMEEKHGPNSYKIVSHLPRVHLVLFGPSFYGLSADTSCVFYVRRFLHNIDQFVFPILLFPYLSSLLRN